MALLREGLREVKVTMPIDGILTEIKNNFQDQIEKQRAALEAAAAAKLQKQLDPSAASDPNNDVQVSSTSFKTFANRNRNLRQQRLI
jgi:hypothetical protein